MTGQKEIVLNHIRSFGSITSQEAIYQYGITRLSDVVFKLKKDGYNIKSKLVEVKNRYGKSCHVSRYELEQ